MDKGVNIGKMNAYLSGVTPVGDGKCECGCQDSEACEAGIAAPVVALTDVGGVSSRKEHAHSQSKAKKYLEAVQDEFGRRHPDGTVCKAQSPETCPFNKSATKADADVGGAKGKSLTWEGKLDDMSGKELDRVVDAFVKAHEDEIYKAIGDGGLYYRTEVNRWSRDPGDASVYEYDVRDNIDRDEIADEVVEALPNESKDLDAKKVIGEVGKILTKRLDGLGREHLRGGSVVS